MSKAGVRNSEIRFLSYPDFIEILNEISLQTHPDLTGPKRLKKLTKRIYPNLMASVHGISKIYKEHTRRYMNNNIIYPRMLQIFNGEHGYITDTTISSKQFESSKNTSPIPQDGTQIMIYPETPVRRLIYDTPSVPNKEEFDSPDIRSSSRLEEKIPSDVVLDSQSKKKKKRKSWTKACGKFCAKLLKSCAKKNPKLRRRSLFGRCGTWLDRKIKKLGKWLGFEIGTSPWI